MWESSMYRQKNLRNPSINTSRVNLHTEEFYELNPGAHRCLKGDEEGLPKECECSDRSQNQKHNVLEPLGHAGDEGPHLRDDGGGSGGSRAADPGCGFSRGTTARSVSLSWGAREVGSPCEWRGGARHCSRVMGGQSGLETC